MEKQEKKKPVAGKPPKEPVAPKVRNIKEGQIVPKRESNVTIREIEEIFDSE